ncbi:MAG TPA: hypothetical protein VD813_05105, partial [Pseudonocardia sp.]|nr:hypothetical protein [Pseudonocardia sp.]
MTRRDPPGIQRLSAVLGSPPLRPPSEAASTQRPWSGSSAEAGVTPEPGPRAGVTGAGAPTVVADDPP